MGVWKMQIEAGDVVEYREREPSAEMFRKPLLRKLRGEDGSPGAAEGWRAGRMSEGTRFLEDCPHCGGTAAVKAFPKPHRHGWVGCAKCSCYIQWQHDPGGAIEKWNRRVKNE